MAEPSADLRDRVSLLVAQVILETSGRCVELKPDEPLFEKGYLESVDLAHLVLRLQSELDVALDPAEAQPRTLRSIDAITRLVAARMRR
jgi:acyl carrier protein